MQHLGLITIFITTVSGILTMRYWPMERGRSFSENIARNTSSRIAFGAYMTVVTLLYYWFLLFWLGPHIGVDILYYVLVGIALGLQLVLAWAPATKGLSMLIHSTAAYGVAMIMPTIVAIILLTASFHPSIAQTMIAAIFLLFAVVVIFLYVLVRSARKNFLHFQLAYFVAFWAVMLAFTYL